MKEEKFIDSYFYSCIDIKKNRIEIFGYSNFKNLRAAVKENLNITITQDDVNMSNINQIYIILNKKLEEKIKKEYNRVKEFNSKDIYNKKEVFFKFKKTLVIALYPVLLFIGFISLIGYLSTKLFNYYQNSINTIFTYIFIFIEKINLFAFNIVTYIFIFIEKIILFVFNIIAYILTLLYTTIIGYIISSTTIFLLLNYTIVKILSNLRIKELLEDKSSLIAIEIVALVIVFVFNFIIFILINH